MQPAMSHHLSVGCLLHLSVQSYAVGRGVSATSAAADDSMREFVAVNVGPTLLGNLSDGMDFFGVSQ